MKIYFPRVSRDGLHDTPPQNFPVSLHIISQIWSHLIASKNIQGSANKIHQTILVDTLRYWSWYWLSRGWSSNRRCLHRRLCFSQCRCRQRAEVEVWLMSHDRICPGARGRRRRDRGRLRFRWRRRRYRVRLLAYLSLGFAGHILGRDP